MNGRWVNVSEIAREVGIAPSALHADAGLPDDLPRRRVLPGRQRADLNAGLSKINPATYGVDAIRQVFLGSGPAGAGLGVSVLGHTMSLVEVVLLVEGLGVAFIGAAVWRFGRQE